MLLYIMVFFVPTLHTELFTNFHSVVAASHHTHLKLLLNSHLLLILYSWITWLLWLKSVICTLLCDAPNTHYKTEKMIQNRLLQNNHLPLWSVSEECRTLWLNGDNPSGEGDVESIPQLLKTFPGQVCRNPIRIEAQTPSGIAASQTGDTFMAWDVIL